MKVGGTKDACPADRSNSFCSRLSNVVSRLELNNIDSDNFARTAKGPS